MGTPVARPRALSASFSRTRPARPGGEASLFSILLAAVMLGLLAAMAGCGSGSDAPGTTATTSTAGIPHPTGATEVVIRSATGGGLIPVEVSLSELPESSLFGDGRMITEGPMIEIYPQPALPNLQEARVTQEGIQVLLEGAREAGLLQVFDYGMPTITDVPTTSLTVDADGRRVVSDIYALGYEQTGLGLSEEQVAARARVGEFTASLSDLTQTLGQDVGPSAPYRYEALGVYVRPAGDEDLAGSSGVAPNLLEWPLADLSAVAPEASGYGRLTVSGEDLEKLRPLVGQATQITIWKSAGMPYRLVFRPLLPDEPTAP